MKGGVRDAKLFSNVGPCGCLTGYTTFGDVVPLPSDRGLDDLQYD